MFLYGYNKWQDKDSQIKLRLHVCTCKIVVMSYEIVDFDDNYFLPDVEREIQISTKSHSQTILRRHELRLRYSTPFVEFRQIDQNHSANK